MEDVSHAWGRKRVICQNSFSYGALAVKAGTVGLCSYDKGEQFTVLFENPLEEGKESSQWVSFGSEERKNFALDETLDGTIRVWPAREPLTAKLHSFIRLGLRNRPGPQLTEAEISKISAAPISRQRAEQLKASSKENRQG